MSGATTSEEQRRLGKASGRPSDSKRSLEGAEEQASADEVASAEIEFGSAELVPTSETTLVRRWSSPRLGVPVELESDDEMARWMEAIPAHVPQDPSERIPFSYPIPGAPPRPVPAQPIAGERLRTPEQEMEEMMAPEDAPTKPIDVPPAVLAPQAAPAERPAQTIVTVRAKLASRPTSSDRPVVAKGVISPGTRTPSSHRQPSLHSPVTRRPRPDDDAAASDSGSRNLAASWPNAFRSPRKAAVAAARTASPQRFFAGVGGVAVLSMLAYVSWPKSKPEAPVVADAIVATAVEPAVAATVPTVMQARPVAEKSAPQVVPTEASAPAEPATPKVKSTDPRAVPEGTNPEDAAAFTALPLADDDGAPLGSIGRAGIHVDRLELGIGYAHGECDGEKTKFTVGTDARVNACFRVVHTRRPDQVTVVWQRNGETLRRASVGVPTMHSYRTRAYLAVRDEYVGPWTVRVMSQEGVELASTTFEIEPSSKAAATDAP